MGTSYHVYLPPPTLATFPLLTDAADLARVVLQTLSAPPDTQTSLLEASVERRRPEVVTQSQASQRTSGPRADDGDTHASTQHNNPTSSHAGTHRPVAAARGLDAGGGERRRARTSDDLLAVNMARRKSRSSASFAVSRSQQDDSASLLSLNTTNSNPSQFPLASGDLSMANLPRWILPLSRLLPLQSLLGAAAPRPSSENHSITCLVCVLSVEPLKALPRRTAARRGQAEELWFAKWEAVGPPLQGGSKETSVVDIKLWDEAAREYGDQVRRGDVVLLEHAAYKPPTSATKAELTLSGSGNTPAKATVLYRTAPRYVGAVRLVDYQAPRHVQQAVAQRAIVPEDKVLRPDLRLERSDPGLKLVADAARWLATWVEGIGPVA